MENIHWLIAFADRHANLINALAALAMVAVSVALWRVSRNQAAISRAQGVAAMRIERAYIGVGIENNLMSFGLVQPENSLVAALALRVTNHGNTPARVEQISVSVSMEFQAPDDPPSVSRIDRSGHAYLMSDGYFLVPLQRALPSDCEREVIAGKAFVLISGYVDYIDSFDVPRRAGFGWRTAVPPETRPAGGSMAYVITMETKPGHHYDHERRS